MGGSMLPMCLLFYMIPSIMAAPPVRLVDMTYGFDESTINWPTSKKFEMNVTSNGTNSAGFWLQTEEYSSGTHVGTHIDAPCHMDKTRWCVDKIPIARFVAPVAVIDITYRAQKDKDAQVKIEDLQRWERLAGRPLNNHIVLMRSGWGSRWPDATSYFGISNNDTSKYHFPGFSTNAAKWLVKFRKVYGLGVDTPSLDVGASRDLKVTQLILGANVFGLVNVANMDKLPLTGAKIMISPMKILNASAAPARILASI